MKVSVLFFGATADVAGGREVEMELADGATASAALAGIIDRYPRLADHKLLFAINQEYALGDEPVADGDELAVFTAVSGG